MNRIMQEIADIIRKNLEQYLPDVSAEELEEGGKIYYMNAKNGTEFDWFVNDHLPPFMVFYSDKENLGAVKATVYSDASLHLLVYDEHGKHIRKKSEVTLEAGKEAVLKLAVVLRFNADDQKIWDADIERIDTDVTPTLSDKAMFLKNRQYYEPSIRRKEIMGKLAIVSKKITVEGWKVGYMSCEEPEEEQYSGWQFYGGSEDQEYVDDPENFTYCIIHALCSIDPALIKYIDKPAGTKWVRISADEFEEDNGQDPYMEKWKDHL